jgi:hypothetical protein
VSHEVKLKTADDTATVFERNGLKVIAFKVEHDPVKPAYGYRLDYHGRSVVISGDTAKSTNLARHPVYCGSSSPACSATMYAAYQSGQFASRCPVRFSCSPWAASARRSALARSAVDPNAV